MKRILFVCTENIQRSRTAEDLYKNHLGLEVKSAGVSETAKNQLTKELLEWADYVFVMEEWHKELIEKKFPGIAQNRIVCLHIGDYYFYMDPELVGMLKEKIGKYLREWIE